MAEYKFNGQDNLNWLQSFNMGGRVPAIAKRIFATYADALEFANDGSSNGTACEGLILSVFKDTDAKKNGVYQIAKIASAIGANDAVLNKLGEGSGTIVVEKYSNAIAEATTDTIGQLIYVTAGETIEEVTYQAGLYVVTGNGTLSKLGTTSASGDIQADVNALQAALSALQTTVSGHTESIAQNTNGIATNAADIATNASAIDALENRFSVPDPDGVEGATKDGGSVLDIASSVADKKVKVLDVQVNGASVLNADTKVANINLTSYENKIEKITLGGNEVSIADKTAAISLALSYDSNAKKIHLKSGENSLGEVDATAFIKDGMLESAEIATNNGTKDGTFLKLTWNTDAGKDVTYVDVASLVDTYTAGNGINIEDYEVSLKVKSGDKYLEVTADGLASKGIDEAISTAKGEIIGNADTDTAESKTIEGVKKYVADAVANSHTHDNKDVLDGITAEKVAAWDAAQANVIESVSVNGVDAAIDGKKASITITAENTALGKAITSDGKEPTEGADTNVVYASGATVSTVLQGIYTQIRGAIAGGVNSVTSGDESITVANADANNPKVSVKRETASEDTISAGHIEIGVGTNGIFGLMYYDGDDVEPQA